MSTARVELTPGRRESCGITTTSPTVGLHEDVESIVGALVSRARIVTGMDIASAAVRDDDGEFPMRVFRGVRSAEFRALRIRTGAGLGGLVLQTGAPARLAEYHDSKMITSDYMAAVDIEGLHGMVCVPVVGPDGIFALLYAAIRTASTPGDVAVVRLEGLAAEAGTAMHHIAARQSHLEFSALQQRQRIAGRLHDSLAQTLFSVGVLAHRSRQQHDAAALLDGLAEIEAVAGSARSELRATLAELCTVPPSRALDLALTAEARSFTATTAIPVWWSQRGTSRCVSPEVSAVVVDGLREGLRNAVRHAGTDRVMATLRWGAGEVVLVLQVPWGEAADRTAAEQAGFTSTTTPGAPGSGLGMLGCRAGALGGCLELTIDPDQDGLILQRLTLPVTGYQP